MLHYFSLWKIIWNIYGELLKLTTKDIFNWVQNQEHRASTFVDLAYIHAEQIDARVTAACMPSRKQTIACSDGNKTTLLLLTSFSYLILIYNKYNTEPEPG
jgi:hypothetical protein